MKAVGFAGGFLFLKEVVGCMKKKTKETLMPYADNLLSLRTPAGLTQEELAERSGLISNTIYRYEAGERGMSFANAVKLANAMNISVADFVPHKNSETAKAISCQQVLDVFFQLDIPEQQIVMRQMMGLLKIKDLFVSAAQ